MGGRGEEGDGVRNFYVLIYLEIMVWFYVYVVFYFYKLFYDLNFILVL